MAPIPPPLHGMTQLVISTTETNTIGSVDSNQTEGSLQPSESYNGFSLGVTQGWSPKESQKKQQFLGVLTMIMENPVL